VEDFSGNYREIWGSLIENRDILPKNRQIFSYEDIVVPY
jgi:hypothetical protein